MRFQPFIRFCAFCLLFSMAIACQVTDIKTRSNRSEITLRQITPHVWRHTTYKEFPQWGKVPANGLVVVNDGEAIMIDTPWDDSQTATLLDLIQEELHASVSKVLVTHFHEDCMGGLGEMHRHGIESYSSALTKVFASEKQLPIPQIGFQTRITLSCANTTLEASYFGGGHTKDNIVVYIPEENVLFGGCLIKAADAKNIGNQSDADMQAWPETLKKVSDAYPADLIVVPGHGDIGGRDLIEHTYRLVMEENADLQSESTPPLADYKSEPGQTIEDKIHTEPHTQPIVRFSLSPDGNYFATASQDKAVKVWDAEKGTALFGMQRNIAPIIQVSFIPGTPFIIAADESSHIVIANFIEKRILHEMDAHSQRLWDIDISSNGDLFATCSHDRTIKIWSTRTAGLVETITHTKKWKYACSFSPRGDHILFGIPSHAVLWNRQTKSVEKTLFAGGNDNYIMLADIAPNGKYAITQFTHESVACWDLQTGNRMHTLGTKRSPLVAFAPDSQSFFIADSTIAKRWDVRDGKLLRSFTLPRKITGFGFSAENQRVWTGCEDRVVVWDMESGRAIKDYKGLFQ